MKPPPKKVTEFSACIWNKQSTYNKESLWLNTLKNEYCSNVTPKEYSITSQAPGKVLNKMKNNGAPGTDQIRCYWIKKLTGTHVALVAEFKKV